MQHVQGVPMISTTRENPEIGPCNSYSAAAAAAVGGGEQALNPTVKPNHMCARGEGLNNGILQQRSGKTVKATRALMTEGAGRGRSWGFLVCATNG